MISLTESESYHKDLHLMSIGQLLSGINQEDQTVPHAVHQALPQIEALLAQVINRMKAGGRLFYIGAGTSGRLGIVDASECPPTFGVPHDWVIGLIAGGDEAIRKAVEFAEDDAQQAIKDLESWAIGTDDFVLGIAASGRTPYVLGGLKACQERGILTGGLTCNPGSPLAQLADFPIEVAVGPEFVTGSTRMKAGTAQKLVLNMISTVTMIQLGRVVGNRMVDMQLSNLKLIDRGVKMILHQYPNMPYDSAKQYLLESGSVRAALMAIEQKSPS